MRRPYYKMLVNDFLFLRTTIARYFKNKTQKVYLIETIVSTVIYIISIFLLRNDVNNLRTTITIIFMIYSYVNNISGFYNKNLDNVLIIFILILQYLLRSLVLSKFLV